MTQTLRVFLCIAGMFPLISLAQNKTSCNDLHNGFSYYYPRNSAERYCSIRQGDTAYEVNLVQNDTSVWRIHWLDDCTFSEKYISGGKKIPPQSLRVLKQHTLIYEITGVTDEYYLFTGRFDKKSNLPVQIDTAWLHEKINVPSNELFKRVANENLLRRAHFSDTSKYAVLYLYRPGKLTNSLGDYLVYFDDDIMCVAHNKSGYIFKILKEGKFNIKSRLLKDESSVPVDIKFGKVYYVKSMIHWGISSRLYNFKLAMELMDPGQGKTEFAETNL
jgi:hypothetical protein